MSLLMQALKKAELAKQKQKQNDLPIISDQVMPKQALSLDEQHHNLSIDESVGKEKFEPTMLPLTGQANEQKSEQISELINEQISTPSTKPSFTELSLTPHQEEIPLDLEKELSALDENKQEIKTSGLKVDFGSDDPARLDQSQGETNPQPEKMEPISSPSTSFPEEVVTAKSSEVEVDATSINKNFTRPQIDTEKKQLKEKENTNQLLDQIKARAVFSSKTPQNNLRSRWKFLVVIVMLCSLLVVAYLYWQQSNNIRNQFPVNVPLSTEQMPLAQAVQPVPTLAIDDASTVAGIENAKNADVKAIDLKVNADPKTGKPILSSELAVKNTAENKNNKVNESSFSDPKKILETNSNSVSQKASTKQASKSNEIQISKGSSVAKINPYLHDAYQAYIAGDTQNAAIQYQKVLQQEPNNRDALLGLAAIALNARQAEQAGTYYGQLLTLDPNDPEAIAGLTSLQQGDPVQSESRLKSALNQSPNAGSILFALGNLYAQQSRWSDAQQTYFRAYTTTPNNADYAFNLAISLDRLNQRKLAIDYYQRAVTLGKLGNVNFNLVKAQQRLSELENIRDK